MQLLSHKIYVGPDFSKSSKSWDWTIQHVHMLAMVVGKGPAVGVTEVTVNSPLQTNSILQK